jgi:Tol biopolymer transport system component
MHRNTWYSLLAAVVLAAPIAGRAQGPQPRVREIATFPGIAVGEALRMPNGHVIVYSVRDSLLAYDLVSKSTVLLALGFDGQLSISPAGDRIAFPRISEEREDVIWSMALDPATGRATGQAQRVSLSPGDTPSFSPDGQRIAFVLYKSHELAVVPATGGPQQILASYDPEIIHRTSWSADGRWVFAEVWPAGSPSVERVAAAGGRSDRIFSYTGVSEGSFDGRIAFYRPDARARVEGRVAYVTAAGQSGAFRIPPGSRPGSDPEGEGLGSLRPLLERTTMPSTTHLVNVADGTVRDLLPGALLSRSPVWSPDGHRLALEDSAGGHYQITVMNADGSLPRQYAAAWDPMNAGFMQWSPDGRMVAYYGQSDSSSVAVLDLSTGRSRVVGASRYGGFIWRPDGTSMVVVRGVSSPRPHLALYEARLDGTERLLRDVGVEFPNARPVAFISDQLVIMSTGKRNASEQFVVPTSGGPRQDLPSGTSQRNRRPGVSPGPAREARWILWLGQNSDRPVTSVEVMTSSGDSLRTLNLPFEVDPQAFFDSFHQDAQHIILVGKTPGDSASKIFLVSLNGDAPRALAQLSGRLMGRFDVSPDGSALVYSVEGKPTSTIYELDVSPIVRAAGKH